MIYRHVSIKSFQGLGRNGLAYKANTSTPPYRIFFVFFHSGHHVKLSNNIIRAVSRTGAWQR